MAVVTMTCALLLTCTRGPIEVDHSEEVERICTAICEQNLACREPPMFEALAECYEPCVEAESLYENSPCGQALRDVYACVGDTSSCEEYLDTNNVDAEDYTCKAEKEALLDACLP